MSSTNTAWLDDEFKAVRDDFLKNVKNPGKHDFTKVTTAKDVWDATDEIQKRQSQTKTLRGLNRTRPFLEALDQFSGTIEVFVQAKPDILALIWVRSHSILPAYNSSNMRTGSCQVSTSGFQCTQLCFREGGQSAG